MPVPEFYHFIRPCLLAVRDNPGAHWREHLKPVAEALNLKADDWNDRTPKTNKLRIEDRMAWALTYLRCAKLIENTKPGHNRITPRGEEYLIKAPQVIKPSDLCVFPEFATFYKGKPKLDKPSKPSLRDPSAEQTPHERVEQAYQEIRSALASEVLERLLTTHPARFEEIIVDLMLKMGYGGSGEDAGQVVGRSGDGGIDGIIRQDPLGLDNIYLQAKRWNSPVGTSEINGFIGALTTRGASKGVLITTSTFSEAARQIANGVNQVKLSLIDGNQLALLMIDHDCGVAVDKPFITKRVDSDYFADE